MSCFYASKLISNFSMCYVGEIGAFLQHAAMGCISQPVHQTKEGFGFMDIRQD